MSSSETVLVVMSALALTGFGVLAVVGWVVTASVLWTGREEASPVAASGRRLGMVSRLHQHRRPLPGAGEDDSLK